MSRILLAGHDAAEIDRRAGLGDDPAEERIPEELADFVHHRGVDGPLGSRGERVILVGEIVTDERVLDSSQELQPVAGIGEELRQLRERGPGIQEEGVRGVAERDPPSEGPRTRRPRPF